MEQLRQSKAEGSLAQTAAGARIRELEEQVGAQQNRIDELEVAMTAMSHSEAAAQKDRDSFERAAAKRDREARDVAEARLELMTRSRGIAQQMTKLQKELKAWTKSVDQLSGTAEDPVEEREIELRQAIQMACEAFVDVRGNRKKPRPQKVAQPAVRPSYAPPAPKN